MSWSCWKPFGKLSQNQERPLGSECVPIHEAAFMAASRDESFRAVMEKDILETVRLHVEDGVGVVAVRYKVIKNAVDSVRRNGLICGITSREGSFLASSGKKPGRNSSN